MLVGRETELGRLRELVTAVQGGEGAALTLRGGAGIGKTTLLKAAEDAAEGLTILRARGSEAESGVPFAALRDLLMPIEELLAELPGPQRAALGGALALTPPAPGDRLAVLAATDGLLRAAAQREPVLALVDDAQWLDEPSLECLRFAARRAGHGVGVVFAVRDDGVLPRDRSLEALEIAPLDGAEAERVLHHAAPALAPKVHSAVIDAAAGNPLALLRLPETLSDQQRAGQEAITEPLAPGRTLDRLFAPRVEGLAQSARTALAVAAASESGSLRTIVPACRALGSGPEDLEEAERAGLLRLDASHLEFVHPLARGSAYHGVPAEQRRAAHAALAETTPGEAGAWHLARAAVGPDERAAAALEEVAAAAGARRAYASAADALEMAARLSEPSPAFVRRMLQAAQAALAAGRPPQTIPLLDEAEMAAADPQARAQAAHLRGLLRLWSGDFAGGVGFLEAEAASVATVAPPLAALMLADAAAGCTAIGDCRRALEISSRASAHLGDGGDPPTRAKVLAIHAWSLCLRGEVPRARPVLAELESAAEGLDPFSPSAPALLLARSAQIPLERFEPALDESLELAERARAAGALFVLPLLLVVAADAAYRLGRWDTVDELCAEAIALEGETQQRGGAEGQGRVTRARLYAARGQRDACNADVDAALQLARMTGQRSGEVFARATRGFLLLGSGDVDAAIVELEAVEALAEELGFEQPTLIPWAPDLIEAYVRTGRHDDARRVLAMLSQQAERSGTRWSAAAAARCAGLVGRDLDTPFAQALELHDQLPLPFERARTLLAHGAAMQRAGRRADARVPLREALATFEELGAAPWSAQAHAALRAAGGRRTSASRDQLTDQELRVARAAADGASTRDIAAELFLSPRTVESHLSQVYRKLGIRSRAALSRALGEAALAAGAVES